MAFAKQAAVVATPSANFEKAIGFINLELPGKNGSIRKLGAIPLKASNANEASLDAWLKEDPTRVAAVLAKLVINYKSVDTAPEHVGFDLS